jgi:hypothetical protein
MTARIWEDVPLVVIHRPACPSCGCWAHILHRSCQNGDGTTTRLAICKRCSGRFKILVELPISGKGDDQDWYDSST